MLSQISLFGGLLSHTNIFNASRSCLQIDVCLQIEYSCHPPDRPSSFYPQQNHLLISHASLVHYNTTFTLSSLARALSLLLGKMVTTVLAATVAALALSSADAHGNLIRIASSGGAAGPMGSSMHSAWALRAVTRPSPAPSKATVATGVSWRIAPKMPKQVNGGQ